MRRRNTYHQGEKLFAKVCPLWSKLCRRSRLNDASKICLVVHPSILLLLKLENYENAGRSSEEEGSSDRTDNRNTLSPEVIVIDDDEETTTTTRNIDESIRALFPSNVNLDDFTTGDEEADLVAAFEASVQMQQGTFAPPRSSVSLHSTNKHLPPEPPSMPPPPHESRSSSSQVRERCGGFISFQDNNEICIC